ncbi:hypothetical protein [Micromonospora sp. DT31]
MTTGRSAGAGAAGGTDSTGDGDCPASGAVASDPPVGGAAAGPPVSA